VNPGPPEPVPFSTRFLNLVWEGLKLFGIALAALLVIAIAVFVSVKTGFTRSDGLGSAFGQVC
jgi:hypothetical protein